MPNVHVWLDEETEKMLDELVAFYGKLATETAPWPGGSFGRRNVIRVLLRMAHRDMKDELAKHPRKRRRLRAV